jgi:hypothetical protein
VKFTLKIRNARKQLLEATFSMTSVYLAQLITAAGIVASFIITNWPL